MAKREPFNTSVSNSEGLYCNESQVRVYLWHDVEIYVTFAKAGKIIPLKVGKTFSSVPADKEALIVKATKYAIEKAKKAQKEMLAQMQKKIEPDSPTSFVTEIYGGLIELSRSTKDPPLVYLSLNDGKNTARAPMTQEDLKRLRQLINRVTG